ncbi:MAG: hypothetical protein ACK5IR_07410, partial [Tropicimonas sp.]
MTSGDFSVLSDGSPCGRGACRTTQCGTALGLEIAALKKLMPMHLVVSMEGTILRAAPTLRKLRPRLVMEGTGLFDLFRLRRPPGLETVPDLLGADSGRLSLSFREGEEGTFKAVIVPLPCGAGALINLS